MSLDKEEFSFRSRQKSLQRFQDEVFDLLIIGGGITGAAVARDATSRGLKVALVERCDFAYGTSSRSSKLIHGGLRYLQNFEFGLVFEALSERALLLRTAPHMVRPLPFYFPVYQGDANGKGMLSIGLWLYDLLALFRTPGFHRGLSQKKMLADIPFLRREGLKGGFRYFDASMWDDVLAVETLRSAQAGGAAIANYVEAVAPIWEKDRITGFQVRDLEAPTEKGKLQIRAHRTVVCTGPWTDSIGIKLSPSWNTWLTPSKGVHIIFDLKRIPIPGAMVMNHPEDGRIAFVIPRPDFGAGVVIVGTTDGPTPADPSHAEVTSADVDYLMDLLNRYFPDLKLKASDILSAYVGVRPLMGGEKSSAGDSGKSTVLQKVSREHHIDLGPGGTIVVAGGKYTTHRKMAEEIVDFTLSSWKNDAQAKKGPEYPSQLQQPNTRSPVNPNATPQAIEECRMQVSKAGMSLPEELLERYGADALSVVELSQKNSNQDPKGFPLLAAQLRHAIRSEMVVHLEDFYLRRVPLYASRKDHGIPWAEELAKVWAEELQLGEKEIQQELVRLKSELARRSAWQTQN
jgi:glycerol-3-phosphate dehydrogenase